MSAEKKSPFRLLIATQQDVCREGRGGGFWARVGVTPFQSVIELAEVGKGLK